MRKCIVRLDADERGGLHRLVRAGKAAAHKIRHANMLLMADADGPGWADEQIVEGLGVSIGQIEHLRKRFMEHGIDSCLERKKQERPSVAPKFDGEKEAKLIALACATAPESR